MTRTTHASAMTTCTFTLRPSHVRAGTQAGIFWRDRRFSGAAYNVACGYYEYRTASRFAQAMGMPSRHFLSSVVRVPDRDLALFIDRPNALGATSSGPNSFKSASDFDDATAQLDDAFDCSPVLQREFLRFQELGLRQQDSQWIVERVLHLDGNLASGQPTLRLTE